MRLGVFVTLTLVAAVAPATAAQEGPEHARRRWEWFYQQRAYPFSRVPEGALQRARGQLERTKLLQAAPPITGSQWESIGPTLISGVNIGRASTVAVNPSNTSVMYLGGAQGGVWKTIDGGVSWVPLTDKQCSLAMGSIAIDPVNPQIVYAATGEQHFSGDSYYGCGVLRSTDGGAGWTRLGAGTFVRSRIARILIAPNTAGNVATTTLFVASDNGLWKSVDGGAIWTQLRAGIATDVVLDPTNASIVYVAIRSQGVFHSADGGTSWSPLGTGFPTSNVGRINISISASQPTTLVAAVANLQTSALIGVFQTTDAAATWTQLNATGASCETQCWYDLFIAIHPTDPNTIYFGGVGLFRSLDGGQTFSSILGGIHVDQHSFTFDPGNPQTVYVTNDGGLYRSTNGGNSWLSLNNGLALTQFYQGISLHPWDPSVVIGGTQDNGTLSFSGNPNWSAILGADGGYTAFDFENPSRRFAETQWTSGTSFGGPRRSDGGAFVLKRTGIDNADPGLFIPPLVMDPSSSQVLYFGTNKVYRTLNAAENWAPIGSSFTGVVSAIAPTSTFPVVYAGTSVGQVHVTSNGETWELRNAGLPTRFVTDIAVDRSDVNTAYATVSGFGTGHVFRTVNRGISWTNVSGNLPDMPVNAIALDPATRGFVMLGTDLGVFVSTDSGGTWTALDNGFPNVAVFDIAYNPATAALIAATHGRGMFKLQLDRPLTVAAVPARRRLNVVEGASAIVADSATVVLSGTAGASASWTATHTNAAWVALMSSAGTGTGRVRWTRNPTGLAAGFYVDTITIQAPGAFDSPARVIDTLFVESPNPILAVNPVFRKTTAPAGSGSSDSAAVLLTGVGGFQQPWTAAARLGAWLTMTSAAGVGTGVVRWIRNAETLTLGTHFDTIVVTAPGAVGSPAIIVDSLIVQPALRFTPASRRDTLVSAGTATANATVQVTSLGDPGGTVTWTSSHGGASWVSLTTTSGQGTATISWTKSAEHLRDGIFVDTITVLGAGAAPVRLVDTLVVIAPVVVRSCVVNHMLGAPCLDAAQMKWLDLAGNRDGVYNLGDLLAYLSRPGIAGLRKEDER